MSEVTINNSPIHGDSTLTAVYGETGPNWARFHTGDDFVPYGTTPDPPDLYSVCNGTVVNVLYDGTLGNQVVIEEDGTGYFWRYCHMRSQSPLSIGDRVTTATVVGVMGATGNVTGRHLHLEVGTTSYWSYDTFLNPSTVLGIPNERGTIIHYDGSIPPTPPTPTEEPKRKKFPWQYLTRPIRKRRTF